MELALDGRRVDEGEADHGDASHPNSTTNGGVCGPRGSRRNARIQTTWIMAQMLVMLL